MGRSMRVGFAVAMSSLAMVSASAFAGGSKPAKPPPPPPAAPPVASGTVSGVVTDEDDKPLANAEVSVYRADRKTPWTAKSDAKGFYAVRDLPPGKASVVVRARGRVAVAQQTTVPATGLALVDAKLEPGVRYSGNAVNGRGEPVEGVTVTATRTVNRRDFMFFWSSQTGESATTGKDGAFVIDGLAATTKYTLTLRHRKYVELELPGLNGDAGGCVEGIEALLEDAAWVKGTVVDAAGKPVAGARVLTPNDDDGTRTIDLGGMSVTFVVSDSGDSGTRTDAQGRFELGSVAPGEPGETMLLRVRAQGFFPSEVHLGGLEAGKERAGVTVKLEAGTAVVEGIVVDDREQPVKGATVYADTEDNGRLGMVKTDAAGKFRFERVATKEALGLSVSADGHTSGSAEKVELDSKDVKIALKRLGRIKVRVLGADGKPIDRVRVKTLVSGDGDDHDRSPVQTLAQTATGFDMPLPLGSVEVTIGATGYADSKVFDAIVEPGQVVEAGDVTLAKK